MPSNHLILCRPLLPPSIFPSTRSFLMSQFFTSGGQSIGASASASVLPMNIQDWFPLGWTGWICLQCRRRWFDSWVGKICWRMDRLCTPVFLGFPCGSAGKESTCNVGDLGLTPGLGKSPGEGNGYPLRYSGLENSMDYSPRGHKELDMIESLGRY